MRSGLPQPVGRSADVLFGGVQLRDKPQSVKQTVTNDNKRIVADTSGIEISVLGATLSDDTRSLAVYSAPEDLFTSEQGKLLFSAIKHIYTTGHAINAQSVETCLVVECGVEQADAVSFVRAMQEKAATKQNIEFLTKALVTARVRMLTKKFGEELSTEAETIRTEGILSKIDQMKRVVTSMSPDVARSYEQATRELMEQGPVKFFVPGMGPLDNALQIDQGTVCYVAGRSGGGKTAWGLNVIYNNAVAGHQCGIIEIEMRRKPIAARLSGIYSNLNTRKVMKGEMNATEKEHLAHSLEKHLAAIRRIRGIEPSVFHVSRLQPTLERWRDEWGCELVLLDYVQIMDAPGGTTTEQVKAASRGITSAAKETGVAIIGISQVKRADGDVEMHHFRDTTQLENDADTMVTLNNEGDFDPKATQIRVKCGVKKNRNNAKAEDVLIYHLTSQRFEHSMETVEYHSAQEHPADDDAPF